MTPTGDGTEQMHTFRVWAPAAQQLQLETSDGRTPMSRDEHGWWSVSLVAPADGRYAYRVDGSDPLPDPRALRMPDGVHAPSALFDPGAFDWTDQQWPGVDLARSVIYELHVGTFTAEGTLDAARSRLDHLVALGVTLVELMPVAAFPGRHGWGYDGVGLYAVHEPYGGPVALQRFVDACHARGLGVCLDVVYNHLGPSGNYLGRYGPYFTDQHRTPWGDAVNLDGPGSDEVRAFVTDNALLWLRDFHVDALRLDAVHALHDDRAVPLAEELSARVDALSAHDGRPRWLIAESDRNDPGTVLPRRAGGGGGLGLHAQWADDVHHGLHVLLTGETGGYYADFADPGAVAKVLTTPFFHDGTRSSFRDRHHGRAVDRRTVPGWRFVAALQTHDQVGNRATGQRLSALTGDGRLAIGAALLLTGPYTPMLFMGEEWAASTPWQYFTDHAEPELAEAIRAGRRAEFAGHGWDGQAPSSSSAPSSVPDPQHEATVAASRLDWHETAGARHTRMLGWYRSLLALRRDRAELRDPWLDRVGVEHDQAAGTLVVHRGRHRVVANLADAPRTVDLGDELADAAVLACWGPIGAPDARGRLQVPAVSAVVLGPVR